MKTTMTAAMVLVAASAWAGDATTRLTEAKLAADRGLAEAESAFDAIASDGAVPEGQRCEARVRRAAVIRQAGDVERSLQAFEEAAATCGSEREPMRLLIEALSGVEQDPEQWAREPMPLHLAIRRAQAGRFTFGYSFGENPAPDPWNGGPPFTGEPISLSVKNAELRSIFDMFEQFTGTEFAVSREVAAKTNTLELVDVPWDQVLSLILQTNGLRAERWGDGWAIGPDPEVAQRGAAVTTPIVSAFTGAPMSISMKDGELAGIFRHLSQFTGQEFRVDPSVAHRTITLELTDVPWDQALSLILKTNGLRSEKSGTGWTIGPDPEAPARPAEVTAPSTAP